MKTPETTSKIAVRMALVFFSILCSILVHDYKNNATFMATVIGTYITVVLMCYVFAKNLMALTKTHVAALILVGSVVIYDSSHGYIFPGVFVFVLAIIALVVILITEKEDEDATK